MSVDAILAFVQPNYWLTTSPANVDTTPGRVIFTFFLLVFLVGAITRVMASKQVDKYKTIALSKTANLLVSMGLIGALLYFFSFERIQFFGGRFWYPIWLLGFLVWGGLILHYVKKQVPLMREEAIERKEKSKYLPKQKRKGKR